MANNAKTISQQDKDYINKVKNAPPFGMKDKIGYLLGDLGGNTLQVIVNTYLLLFMTSVIGLKPSHFAIIVAICKALDAVNDPIIGGITDRAKGTNKGKYTRIIGLASIPMSILTVLLFVNISGTPYTFKIIWCLLIYFLWGVISTFWNIPYGTMLNTITTDQGQRAELSNFRSIGSTGANVLMQTIAPLVIFNELNEATASGFIILSIIGGIFSIICLYFTTKWCNERVVINVGDENKKIDYVKIIKSFAKNRPLIAVILAYITTKFFVQTTGITYQYVFQVYYQNTEALALLGLLTMIPLVIGMLVVKPLIKRFGKKNLITWPMLISAALFASLAIFPVSPQAWIIIHVIANSFMVFFNLLIWSLIADGVDFQAWLTKERNDGTVYATVTFLVFFVSSLSTSFITMLLDAIGFVPELQVNQAVGVAERIKVMAGTLPAIGCIIVFILFMFIYNLSDERMAEISAEVTAMSSKLGE